MAEVIEINDMDGLVPYQLAWNALLPMTPNASFFHTLDWLILYWRHFGDDQKLRVLIVLACGKPIGIVPLCVRREHYRFGTVRVLTYPLHDWGVWFGPIGPNVAATMLMAMRHIESTPRDWDMIELRWANGMRSDRARTLRAMWAVGFRPKRAVYQRTSVVEFQGNWADYWGTRPRKWRSNVRRAEKRLATRGPVELIRHRPISLANGDGDPAWDLYDACYHIAARSWQGRLEANTTLSSERVGMFLREAHAAAARLGMVDINLLTIGGEPAAFAYNYHYNRSIQGLRSGFDRSVASAGAGNVLLARSIQDSFSRGDQSYDLGVGGMEYKSQFRTKIEMSYRFTHYPFTRLRSLAARLARWVQGRSSEEAATK
ncbi:MAG: GNAT family N-acetyltransferase [Pirellulales bacterium]|nr:GNAT family N-acetyltransferase [Pirellulales bacterium]